MMVLANVSDAEFFFGVAIIIAIGVAVHRFKTKCRSPKCGKWGSEIRETPYVEKVETSKADEWVMENTKTVVREEDRTGGDPVRDSSRQVRESVHERIRYEVETKTTTWLIPCKCKRCGFKWTLDLPPTVEVAKRRIG